MIDGHAAKIGSLAKSPINLWGRPHSIYIRPLMEEIYINNIILGQCIAIVRI